MEAVPTTTAYDLALMAAHRLIVRAAQTLRSDGPLELVVKIFGFALRPVVQVPGFIRATRAARVLRRQLAGVRSLEEAVELSFGFRADGFEIAPIQHRTEIVPFLRFLEREQVQTVLEIGSWHGGTLFLWARVATADATIVGVDLPLAWNTSWKPIFDAFARGHQRVKMIGADSHDPLTMRRVERVLGGREVDFLFIDGDHTYEGVRKDFEMYGKLVRKGGIIAFHDIVQRDPCEVRLLWDELKRTNDTEEFVNLDAGHKGIGVLRA